MHKLLENVETSLEEATRELRVFTYLLHPLALENDGLERTLRTYLDGFARRTRLKAQMTVAGKVEDLPFALQCSLLRIIQEALANVHRHACASHVSISLRMTSSALKLVVADDGRGMRGPAGTSIERRQDAASAFRACGRGCAISAAAWRSTAAGRTARRLAHRSAGYRQARSRAPERAPSLAVALDGGSHQT